MKELQVLKEKNYSQEDYDYLMKISKDELAKNLLETNHASKELAKMLKVKEKATSWIAIEDVLIDLSELSGVELLKETIRFYLKNGERINVAIDLLKNSELNFESIKELLKTINIQNK